MGLFEKFRKKKTEKKSEIAEISSPSENTEDRYIAEHRVLPNWVLGKDGASVICSIIENKGEFFTELYKFINDNRNDYVCPYAPEDFTVRGFKLTDGENAKMALFIQMPKPKTAPLCLTVCIAHNEELENRRYITVELSSFGGLMICEWKDGSHLNFGEYSEDALYKILSE